MKKIIYILIISLVLSSCGNDWLDNATPHDGTVAPSVLYGDEMAITNAIVGSLDLMKEYYYDRHVTVGYRFYYLGLDFMGNDIVSNPGQWWTYEAQWHPLISSSTGYQSSYFWAMFYEVINDVNSKIAGVEASSVSEEFKAKSIAELRAIRALSYFNLARAFQFSYKHAGENAECVPIYTTPTDATREGNDRASMKEVFTLIIEDLTNAVENLSTNASPSRFFARVTKNVALAWRANVYLELQEWAKAAEDAKNARNGFTLMSADIYRSKGFNALNGNSEWMWGFEFRSDQAMSYASLFSHVDIYRKANGYKNFFINETFVNKFTETDMRNQFGPSNIWAYRGKDKDIAEKYEKRYFVGGPSQNWINNGDITGWSGTAWGKWGSTKFTDNESVCGDYGMLRAGEMYLVEAEALVNSGKVSEGHDVLFELQKHRDPNAIKSNNTGNDLIEEILLERRKELYGEIGTQYFDLKRYNKGFSRDGNHSPAHLAVKKPAGDPTWIFQIPQTEFDRNKNIKNNNPR